MNLIRSTRSMLVSKEPRDVYAVIAILRTVAGGFILPAYSLFLHGRGLTVKELQQVNALFMLVSALLEIPTGLVGDVISNKFSTVSGLFFWGLAMFLYAGANDMNEFYLAEATAALGAALISGSLRAWLKNASGYDEPELEAATIRAETWARGLRLGISVIAGYVLTVSLELPWLIAGVITMVAVISAIRGMKADKPTINGGRPLVVRIAIGVKMTFITTRQSVKFVLTTREVLLLTVGMAVLDFAMQPVNMTWSLRYSEALGTEAAAGLVAAGISIGMLAGLRLLYMINSKVTLSASVKLALATTIILVSLSASNRVEAAWLQILFFCLHEVGRGMLIEPFFARVLELTPNPATRATVVSVIAVPNWLARAAGLMIFGSATNLLTLEEVWWVALVPATLAFFLFLGSYFARREG